MEGDVELQNASTKAAMKQHLEAASAFIVEQDLVREWNDGAIYPAEMAFFLAMCAHQGVETVVESGRQDGYSTLVLGRWAKVQNKRAVSIDLELDPPRAAQCHARMKGLPIELVVGNAFGAIGRVLRSVRAKPFAYLLDGPKGIPAMSMIAASRGRNLRVAGIHNILTTDAEYPLLIERGCMFYEELEGGERWAKLHELESEFCRGSSRTLEKSQLGVIPRPRLPMLSPLYGVFQPFAVRAAWELGQYRNVERAGSLWGMMKLRRLRRSGATGAVE